jgi:hypothetical protein
VAKVTVLVQLMRTLVTFPFGVVPPPLPTVQLIVAVALATLDGVGCVSTVILYGAFAGTPVVMLNVVAFALIAVLSPPLFCSTSPVAALSPVIVPPMVYSVAAQLRFALVTFAVTLVPEAFAMTQVLPVGCVSTVSA